jgi:hypothetical protein
VAVIAFPALPAARSAGEAHRALVARVTGSFGSPSGRLGTLTGSYRLERFEWGAGRLMAAGVFIGVLVDADGTRVGLAARRHTSPVDVVAAGHRGLVVLIRPVQVDLLGFLVTMDATSITVRDAAAIRIAVDDTAELRSCR